MVHLAPRPRIHSSRRGVDVMVATVLLVAIVVVLAAVLFVLVEQYTSSTSSAPTLGASLALATPIDAVSKATAIAPCSAAACDFYNMSVQSATSGMELHDLLFELEYGNGSLFVPTGGVVVLDGTGTITAQYSFSAGWTSGGTTIVSTHLTVVLYTSGASPQSLSGDFLRVVGVSAYSGSISIHIF
jgi:hypothetical protein